MAIIHETNNLISLFARPFGNIEKKAIALAFVQHPAHLGQLLASTLAAPPRQAARMAWVIEEISSNWPEALEDFTDTIISLIIKTRQQAVLRNLLKVMLLYPISEANTTALFDRCLQLASGHENDVAVRCNALSLAYHIARQHHGLEQEVFALADNLRHEGGAGFRARTRKLLQELCRNTA
jgi:hypothetical protein